MMRFKGGRLCAAVLVGAGWCAAAQALDEVVVFPAEKGQLLNRFFYDFKSPGAPKKFVKNDWAGILLEEYGFTGIRTSVYGTDSRPAHPEPGVVLDEYYKNETRGLQLAKKINPGVRIFASKKLDGTKSFPEWTKDGRGVVPAKYAVLLADYLEYMKGEGLEVDILGIDNERRFNEGKIMPGKHHDIVMALRKLTAARGLQMPKIIGPEDYAMGRNNWMKTFSEMNSDTLDIFGGHYYTRYRPLAKLEADLAYAGGREKWHTELHWDEHGAKGEGTHSMNTAVCAFLALWDCTDSGMNGFSWWDFNPKKTRRDYLMHAATVPLVNAYPVKVVDPDGSETADLDELHTRAFLQGDKLTVYVLNFNESREWNSLRIRLASGSIIGNVQERQWTEETPPEGRGVELRTFGGQSFRVKLAPQTISIFTCTIKP